MGTEQIKRHKDAENDVDRLCRLKSIINWNPYRPTNLSISRAIYDPSREILRFVFTYMEDVDVGQF